MKTGSRRSFLVDAAGVAATGWLALTGGGLMSMLLTACKYGGPVAKYGGPDMVPSPSPTATDDPTANPSEPTVTAPKYGGPSQMAVDPPEPDPTPTAPTATSTATSAPVQNRPKYGGPPRPATKYGGPPAAKYGGPNMGF